MASFILFPTLAVRPFVSARVAQTKGLPLDVHFADVSPADVQADAVISYGFYATSGATFMAAARAPESSSMPTPEHARPRGMLERSIADILTNLNRHEHHTVALDLASIEPLVSSAEAAAQAALNGIWFYLQRLDAGQNRNEIGSIVISRENTPVSRLQSTYENQIRALFPNAEPLEPRAPVMTPEGRMTLDTTRGPLLLPIASRARDMTLHFRSYRRRDHQDPVEVVHRVTTPAFLREAVYTTMTFICNKDDQGYALYLARSFDGRHQAAYNHDTVREALALLSTFVGCKEETFVEKGYIRPATGGTFQLSRLTTPSVPDTMRIASILTMQPSLSGANQLLAFLSSIGITARVEGEDRRRDLEPGPSIDRTHQPVTDPPQHPERELPAPHNPLAFDPRFR